MLANIRIVLCETSHPGNIGSAARAMKTMGLDRLYLVAPKFFPDPKATELAAGADDVLAQAVVVDSLSEALADCQLVIATSARTRDVPLTYLTPRETGLRADAEASQSQVALVFGRERTGLTNAQLLQCQYHTVIPANPLYSSLNLAQAVQVLCYEIRMASLGENPLQIKALDELAPHEDVARFYQHLEQVLQQYQFLNPKAPKRIMPRLKALFNRVRMGQMEVNLLRGILSALEKNKPVKTPSSLDDLA